MTQLQYPQWPGWETVRVIGRGSFGAVYEIRRMNLGNWEQAALKVISIPGSQEEVQQLRSEGYDDESLTKYFHDSLEKFQQEYTMMAQLKGHTNIVYCDDIRRIQKQEGFGWDIYIKMELLTPMKGLPVPEDPERQAIRLGMDLCSALCLCRQKQVIHRDIKPENIFVSRDGHYKLGDFGIAKTMDHTAGGTKAGTYDYMAPEVYLGRPYGTGADLCSLGLVLYWMLNRRTMPFLPIDGQRPTPTVREAARLRRFRGEPLPAPAQGSPALQAIVLKACAFDPARRYQSPEEMLRDLEAVSHGLSVPDPVDNDATQREDPPPRPKRRSWIPLVIIAGVLVLTGLILGAFLGLRTLQQNRDTTEYDALMEQALSVRDADPDQAWTLYQQAMALAPEEEAPKIACAYTLYLCGEYDACVSFVENDLALGRSFSPAGQTQVLEILGCAWFELADYSQAANYFRMSAAGGDLTVPAMRDFAVSLGRLGYIEEADQVMDIMRAAGATGVVMGYVQAEIDLAMEKYLAAQEGFLGTLNATTDPVLQRRALGSLAQLYDTCAQLDPQGLSPIQDPAYTGASLLAEAVTRYGLQADPLLTEQIAWLWYQAYTGPAGQRAYLENAANTYLQALEYSIPQEHLYVNLFNTLYLLYQDGYSQEDLLRIRECMFAYAEDFPHSYTPHALLAMASITGQNQLEPEARDYTEVVEQWQAAQEKYRSTDDPTYYLQLEGLMNELQAKGWLD